MSIIGGDYPEDTGNVFSGKIPERGLNGLFQDNPDKDIDVAKKYQDTNRRLSQSVEEVSENSGLYSGETDFLINTIIPKTLVKRGEDSKPQKSAGLFGEPEVPQKCEKSSDTNGEERRKRISPYEVSLQMQDLFDFAIIRGFLHVYIKQYRYWKILTEQEGKLFFRKYVPIEFKMFLQESAYAEIYRDIRVEAREIEESDLSRSKDYLNFRDRAISWRSWCEAENPKELYFLKYMQVDAPRKNPMKIKRNKESPYNQTVNRLFCADKKLIHEFEKFYGLALSNIRDKKIAVFLYGGSNTGKTVLLTLLKKLIGKEFVSSISFAQLGEEFAVTQLIGKTLNMIGETSGVANRRLDIFKSLTGNDTVTVCFKGKDHFQFENHAMLCFACNEFPEIASNVTDSFFSRIAVFPFRVAIDRKDWIENMEDELWGDSEEIVSLAVRGLQRLDRDGYVLGDCDAMKKEKRKFVSEANSFLLFYEDHIRLEANSCLSSRRIEKEYFKYCKAHDYKVVGSNVWSRFLQKQTNVEKTNLRKQEELGTDDSYNCRG